MALRVTTYNCPNCGVNLERDTLDLRYMQPCPHCHTPVIRLVNSIATNWFTFFAPLSSCVVFVVLAAILTVFWFRAANATMTLLLQYFGASLLGALLAG